MTRNKSILSAASLLVLPLAFALRCAVETTSAPPRSSSQDAARTPNIKPLDPSQTGTASADMIPLLRAGNKTRSLKEIRVGVIEDPNINAANAGGGELYVTTSLLEKANDDQLRGILAHEIAHDDLGHVAKAQVLGTGLNLGVILLEQIIPGSSVITRRTGLQQIRRVASRSARRRDFATGRLLQGRDDRRTRLGCPVFFRRRWWVLIKPFERGL